MAHWAELDDNNVVIRVTVGDNNEPDEGYAWLIKNLGGRWVQTSYSGRIRKQFAGVGYTYDEAADVFIAPQPYPSWVLNDNHDWQPPTPMPKEPDKGYWEWDEPTLSWFLVLSD